MTDFWNRFQYIASKARLIRRYEVGLSQQALEAGLTIKPYITEATVRSALPLAAGHQWAEKLADDLENSTLFYWDGLIEHLRFPFLKTSLPRHWKPPAPPRGRIRRIVDQHFEEVPQHESMATLGQFIEQQTDYPYELIRANLVRLGHHPLDGQPS
jgi:lipopolysaccharide biosynthesis protein